MQCTENKINHLRHCKNVFTLSKAAWMKLCKLLCKKVRAALKARELYYHSKLKAKSFTCQLAHGAGAYLQFLQC